MPSKLVWERMSDRNWFLLVLGGKVYQVSTLLSRKTFLKAEIFLRSAAAVPFSSIGKRDGSLIFLHSLSFSNKAFGIDKKSDY